jgi:hypothetical protein
MLKRLPKLTYSNVIATVALFVALGGAAIAAGLPRHSVGARQLKHGAVTTAALRRGAVTNAKLGPRSVSAGKLSANAVGAGNLANGAVTSTKLAANSVINATIANGVVGTNKLGNNVVTTTKIANGAVTLAKLGEEVAPLLGTLRSGQTLRGVFDLGASGKESAFVHSASSFQYPLATTPAAPETNVLKTGQTNAACPGITGGNQQTPQAAAGQLCVYITGASGATLKGLTFDLGSVTRLGFGLRAQFEAKGEEDSNVEGFWAVSAP